MYVRTRSIALLATVVGLLLIGCNIFGEDERVPGAAAVRLQESLERFLQPWNKNTITTDQLLLTAKETRQYIGLGALDVAREFAVADEEGRRIAFPLEDRDAAERPDLLQHIRAIEYSLALVIYAGSDDVAAKALAQAVSDSRLRSAAKRVIITDGLDRCAHYADFATARLLGVMTDFRMRLDNAAAATDHEHLSIVVPDSLSNRYELSWPDTSTAVDLQLAEAVNGAIAWLESTVGARVRPTFNPRAAFRCPFPSGGIIDMAQIELYTGEVLLPSMRSYAVNTGVAGNLGVGDNDDDGSVDEEMLNGVDDDGDGLIDEDARL